MARIAGINLPSDKRIEVALTYIYGIGNSQSKKILSTTKINSNTRVKDLTDTEISSLREYIEKNLIVEAELSREVSGNIKRLKDIKAYRGLRHIAKLPVRGQRTKTNARTKRGKKVTVGSGRKKAAAKT